MRPKQERRRTIADDLYQRLVEERQSFWSVVYPLYMGVGLIVSLLLVVLLEYRDNTFKTDAEVARVLSLPVLAVIPLMRTTAEQKWAWRRRVCVALGFGTTVAACLAIVAYTFFY